LGAADILRVCRTHDFLLTYYIDSKHRMSSAAHSNNTDGKKVFSTVSAPQPLYLVEIARANHQMSYYHHFSLVFSFGFPPKSMFYVLYKR